MFKFKESISLVGIEVRSLKHDRIPPLNRCSVWRELKFCRKRTKNFDLPDPVGPAIKQVNGCFNLTYALIAVFEITLSPRNLLSYTQPVRTYYRLSNVALKVYSIDLILTITTHYRHTYTIATLSFNIFILANRDGAVGTPA